MKPLDAAVRLEWTAVAVAAVVLYALTGVSWWLFALLILAPDLSMLGYLAGPRIGALAYNMFHMLVLPALLAVAGLWTGHEVATAVATIWVAHIAADRALGYGLKRASGFRDTHLGRIGRDVNP